ncbi:MAG: DUF3341 domain-containing protein [Candidatus Sulfotelmatobacter sp.]
MSETKVESAGNALKGAGFTISNISVLLPGSVRTGELVTERFYEGATGRGGGCWIRAAVGGALGWMVGVGALAIPGIGPVIAALPLLAGVGTGGALGGFGGSHVGLGIPEYQTKKYEGQMLKGGILVGVHCETSEQANCAREVLQTTGAQDVATSRETSAAASEAA